MGVGGCCGWWECDVFRNWQVVARGERQPSSGPPGHQSLKQEWVSIMAEDPERRPWLPPEVKCSLVPSPPSAAPLPELVPRDSAQLEKKT